MQMLHGQQRRGLGRIEPEPREFDPLGVAALAAEVVAVGVAVVDDRRFHAAAQVFEVALERRARDFELVEQRVERHQLARRDQLLDLENAFGLVHGGETVSGKRWPVYDIAMLYAAGGMMSGIGWRPRLR